MSDLQVPVKLLDLFTVGELQSIQDAFSTVAGVASIITLPDGTPVTRPTNFTGFCRLVRATEAGRALCVASDQQLGQPDRDSPRVSSCLSSGLLDAGVAIQVGSTHAGNWLVGQVRHDGISPEQVAAFAAKIGLEEGLLVEEFHRLPAMSVKRLQDIAQALSTFADELSSHSHEKLLQLRLKETLVQAQEDQSAALARLVVGVAHEINTPLGAISSCNSSISVAARATIDELLILKYSGSEVQYSTTQWLIAKAHQRPSQSEASARIQQKKLRQALAEVACRDPQRTADELLSLGFPDDPQSFERLIQVEGYEEMTSQVARLAEILLAVGIVEEATKKATEFVRALQRTPEYGRPSNR